MEEERRVSNRISFDSAIQYHQKGSQKRYGTVAKDISDSGIGFISNEFLPKNSHIVFELCPPWHQEPIQTLAEVAWVSDQPYSERFYIGAKFLEPLMQA